MKGYRTYLAAALAAVAGVLAQTDWVHFLSDISGGAVATGMAVIMAVLRSITSTPAGKAD